MIFRFGHVELDDATRELRVDGKPVETEPKAFDLLVYLIRHRDRAVSKDEILETLWPNQIVSETALSRAVMKARRAIGAESSAKSAIRTLHGHGFRFVADVETDSDAEAPVPAARTATEPSPQAAAHPSRRRRLGPAVVAAGAVVIAVVIAVVLFTGRDERVRLEPGRLAVLPVHDATDAEDSDWIRLGLMSLMRRMLEEGGVDVASDRLVLNAVGDAPLSVPPDATMIEQIRARSGASAVLYTTLGISGGLNRLTAVVTHADGTRSRRVIVGQSPAAIAADIANVIVGIVNERHQDPSPRFSLTSTDPFVNELYARALDLELRGEIAEAREMFRVAAAEEPELFWPRYEIALCTRDLDEHDEADRMFRELYAEAVAGQDARAVVATLNSHGRQKMDLLAYAEAETLLQQALAAIGERPLFSERAVVNINLALVDSWQGDDNAAAVHYEDALAAYADGALEPSPAFLNNYAGLLNRLGRSAEAKTYSERAVAGFRMRGQRRYEAPALNRLAKITRNLGDTETALQLHEQARAIYAELGNVRGELSVMDGITALYRETGDLTRARRNAEEVLDRALGLADDPMSVAHALIQLAYVEAADGQYETAIERFDASAAAFEQIGDRRGVRDSRLGIANAAIKLGDTDRAHRIGDELLSAAGDDESTAVRAHMISGRAHLADGAIDDARDELALAYDYAQTNDDTRVLSRAGLGLAEASLRSGDFDDARDYLEAIRPHAGKDHDFQRLDARVAFAEGRADQAVEILSALRIAAGEGWNEEDEALLAEARR